MNNASMNPLEQIVAGVKRGVNPMQLIQQMAGSSPQAAQAMKMMQGKSPEQLRQIALNMCKERGINPDTMIQQLFR